jgi:hypothetical protein
MTAEHAEAEQRAQRKARLPALPAQLRLGDLGGKTELRLRATETARSVQPPADLM